MNCPMHHLIFRSRGRSYRELPLRLFEFGTVYRYEKSGVVHGLTRVRGLTMDDSHIYCTQEQMPGELRSLLRFVLDLLADYGLSDFYLELSTKGDTGKFIGSDEEWAEATETLRQAAVDSGLELVPDPGGAAYYGPKISVQAKDAIGRSWQMSTIQVDFNHPKRFELAYTAADGSRQQPVVLHRALFGSIERFFGVLTEHYAGAFPAWLAPVQVVGIPIADEHVRRTCEQVAETLRARGIRVDVDTSDDRMQKKIRNHTTQKVPFMLLAGGKDVEAGAVSFRFRDGSQINGVPVDVAVATVVADWVAAAGERVAVGRDGQRSNTRIAVMTGAEFVEQDGVGVPDALQRLWTPHRMAYIKGEDKPAGDDTDGCPFCRLADLDDADALIVARGELVYGVLNLYPYNPGHLMVVPYRHVADYTELTSGETVELAEFTQRAMAVARVGVGAARVQHRHEPGRDRGRRDRRAPAPARGAAVGRRLELHAGGRPHEGAAAAAGRDPRAPGEGLAPRARPCAPPTQ